MLAKIELSTSGDQFQSYLYGIEIDIFYVDDETGHVSIVPLWN